MPKSPAISRAYAFNAVTLDNVEYYKADNKEDAVAGLFDILKATAIRQGERMIYLIVIIIAIICLGSGLPMLHSGKPSVKNGGSK